MKAIRIHKFGGPEVLELEDVDAPEPGRGEARVRVDAAGVNFIDIYQRTGAYPGELPRIPGLEAAGVVDGVGADVTEFQPGDRVAYAMHPGAYAEYACVRERLLVRVPDDVGLDTAAAVMLQGMTAHYLVFDAYALRPGDTALVHAAAGGVGALLVQLARRRGAHVIGTVSTGEKAEVARSAGADEVIFYTEQDFVEEVQERTAGRGVDVVYDSVGRATFSGSLDCVRPRGTVVLFGQSSGAVEPVDLQILNRKGSLFVTRPSLGHYVAERRELLWRAGDLFRWIEAGELTIRVDRMFPLAAAADAHRYMQDRQTKGKLLLLTTSRR